MKNPWKVSTIILAMLLGVVASTGAVRQADAEPQPAMHTALERLREAKLHLEHAAHDHGGHRTKALAATQAAIEETQLGIKWANEHH
jgi:hypothetical protein